MPDLKNSHLVLIATVATFALLVLIMFFPIPEKNDQIFMAFGGMILGYFFGSSNSKPVPGVPVPPTQSDVNAAVAANLNAFAETQASKKGE